MDVPAPVRALSGPWRVYFEGFATKDLPDAPDQSVFRSCEPRAADTAVVNLTRPLPRMLSALAAWGSAWPALTPSAATRPTGAVAASRDLTR